MWLLIICNNALTSALYCGGLIWITAAQMLLSTHFFLSITNFCLMRQIITCPPPPRRQRKPPFILPARRAATRPLCVDTSENWCVRSFQSTLAIWNIVLIEGHFCPISVETPHQKAFFFLFQHRNNFQHYFQRLCRNQVVSRFQRFNVYLTEKKHYGYRWKQQAKCSTRTLNANWTAKIKKAITFLSSGPSFYDFL